MCIYNELYIYIYWLYVYTMCFLWKLVIRQFPRGFGRSAECSIDLSQQSTCFGSKSGPKPSESIALTPPHLLASPKCRHKDSYTHFASLDVSPRTLDDADLWHDSSPVHDTMSTEIVYFPMKRIFHKIRFQLGPVNSLYEKRYPKILYAKISWSRCWHTEKYIPYSKVYQLSLKTNKTINYSQKVGQFHLHPLYLQLA